MPTTNECKQHKNNNTNITKYLEFNKDSVLDLAEKNYENLIEVLINNDINNSMTSSNPIPSLSSSS